MNYHSRMAFLTALFVFATLLWQPVILAAEESPAEQTTSLTVTVTDLPKNMVILNAAALPDGTWWQEWLDPDSGLAYECRRLNPIRPTDDAVRRFLRMEWPEAHDVRVTNFPEAAEKLTYPTSQIWFLTGNNEVTRLHLGAMVFTDHWSFWLDTSLPADDAVLDDANTPVDLCRILLSMELTFERDTTPPLGSTVLTGPDEDTPPSVSNEIMTSLIRLLDETRSLGDAASEFHYEGIRMISLHGLAIHSFVRISDNGGQYYGVTRRGLVYRMDDDGMYDTIREFDRTWPDETPLWWGEYRADNSRILWIRELREGPDGLYIRFSFGVDNEEIGGSLAEMDEDEHTAYHQDLVFRIDDDAKTITVTREENDRAAEESPAAWMAEAPGVYTRAR